MKVNAQTALVGPSVVLVPYRKEHVAKYHQWMDDEEILELTGSERLSLDEEYAMQEAWLNDDDKLTFIVLSRDANPEARDPEGIAALPMIGDVNMFLREDEVECEVMIAEKALRRKGLALEALRLILQYATSPSRSQLSSSPLPISPSNLLVRIGASNAPSIALFEKLGFGISKPANVFGQVEMKFAHGPGREGRMEELVGSWGETGFEEVEYPVLNENEVEEV